MFLRLRTPHTAVLCLGILLFVGLPSPARADADESFRKAIQAADRGRWEDAAKGLREAIAEDSQESERRVLISGVFSRPYFPHFYLGQALFQLGAEHCEKALAAWNTSRAQGVIQKSKAQFQELQEGLQACNGLLLPSVISAATREIERAAALEERLPNPLPDPALAGAVQAAREDLIEARRRFETGRSEARLSDLRQAETRARTAGQQLAAVGDQIEQAQERLRDAVSAAQAALAEAERAQAELRDQLAKPQNAAAWRRSGSSQNTAELHLRLRAAGERLVSAKDLPTVATVQADAESALAGYREAQQELQAVLVDNPPPQAKGATRLEAQPPTTPPSSLPTPPPDSSSSVPNPAAETPSPATPREAISEDAFRQLTTHAERLLSRLEADSSSALVEIQKSRLTLLLREGREPTARQAPRLHQRTTSSLEALRLLAGAQAYLKGQAQEAARILDNHEIPPGPLAAQTHLFLAASRFALFHTRGSGETLLLQQATESTRQAHEFEASLTLDPQAFSPSFQQFFTTAILTRSPKL